MVALVQICTAISNMPLALTAISKWLLVTDCDAMDSQPDAYNSCKSNLKFQLITFYRVDTNIKLCCYMILVGHTKR